MNVDICVIGLGRMGSAMARTLAHAGADVAGVDLDETACERLAADGIVAAALANTPAAALYLLSLPSAHEVRQVVERDPGLLERAEPGTVIVDTSTSEPAVSRELARRLAERDVDWLDAPVSGGPSGAAAGELGMLVGGDADVLERVRSRLDILAARLTHVGPAGAGHTVKLANNFLCAAHLLSTAEALRLAIAGGVEPSACLAGLNSGSGRSAVSEGNYPRWILSGSFDSGFTAALMRKDLALARAAAEKDALDLPLLLQTVERWTTAGSVPDDADFNRIVSIVHEVTDT